MPRADRLHPPCTCDSLSAVLAIPKKKIKAESLPKVDSSCQETKLYSVNNKTDVNACTETTCTHVILCYECLTVTGRLEKE